MKLPNILTPVLCLLFLCAPAGSARAASDCVQADKLSAEASALARSDPAAAEEKLTQAIRLCGASGALYYNRAMLMARQQRELEAIIELEKAITVNPDLAQAYNALAYLTVMSDGDRSSAVWLARKAIDLSPDNAQYRDTYALAKPSDIDAPPAGTVKRPDAVAIVIGNRNYRSVVLPAVRYAFHDAFAVKKYLVESLGFSEENIILLRDATTADLARHFGGAADHKGILYDRVRKDRSEVFVYYSGHGAPDEGTRKAYLLPADADPAGIRVTGYALDTLYDNLAKLNREKNAASVTVVLDASFSGNSPEGMLVPGAGPVHTETSIPLLSARNAVVLSGARSTQISSWYPEKNHGLFTYYFLKSIKKAVEEKRQLTVRDLETALLGPESVNDVAWRLFNHDQEPQVMGNKALLLAP